MDAKKRLARTVTAMYHGEDGAREGEAHFSRVVQSKEVPKNVEKIRSVTPNEGEPAWKVIVMSGLVSSNSEARRQIQQGAVEVEGVRLADANEPLGAGREYLIRVGKRRFKRVFLERGGI